MGSPKIFSGKFKGFFNTNQQSIVSKFDETFDKKTFRINIYKGELLNAVLENSFEIEKLKKRDSLILKEVKNVNVIPADVSQNTRIYNFSEVVLSNPKVTSSSIENGKTYGIIEGDFTGIELLPFVTFNMRHVNISIF